MASDSVVVSDIKKKLPLSLLGLDLLAAEPPFPEHFPPQLITQPRSHTWRNVLSVTRRLNSSSYYASDLSTHQRHYTSIE
ncbi:hypothetical protein KIN20_003845 [Parelaphostrongylus tenuis]|uniref:Uncharacterized protein n=1 Tax=Parelaphostrongylus tenuis TaxID=148309 RepID=A0AAD5LXH9_PARTN|nr:hypothetical protein KIN20_003845 [Parelaphostrongylus tenuis]